MNLISFAALYVRFRPKKVHVALPLLIMAVLYGLSSLPGTPSPEDPAVGLLIFWLPPTLQTALHVPAYAVLAWAWRWALDAWLHPSSARAIAAYAIASAYGVFDEWHQSFVPGRYASVTDVFLDAVGAALGIWLAAWMSRYAASSAIAFGARDTPEQ